MKKQLKLLALLMAAGMLTACGSATEESSLLAEPETELTETQTETETTEVPTETEQATAPADAEQATAPTETEQATASGATEQASSSSQAETERAAAPTEGKKTNDSSSAASKETAAPETTPVTEQTEAPIKTPVLENKTGFPDLGSFRAGSLSGTTFDSSYFAGADVTVINLWATYCGPCISEMPEIAAFQASLPGNVRLITCCVDVYGEDGKDSARSILKDAGYNGETMIDPEGDLQSLVNEMMYVPTTVFVDSEGHLLGEAIIGGGNVEANYTARINEALTAMGKDPLR